MKRFDAVVVGGANFDYLIRTPELPRPGRTVAGEEFQEAPGGKGANQAVACARLGMSVAFIGAVGDDRRGKAIVDRLNQEGVDTRFIARVSRDHTGIAVIQTDVKGRKQIATAPGANLQLTTDMVVEAEEAIRRAAVLLLQLEVPLDAVSKAVNVASDADVRIVFDPAPPRSLPIRLLRRIDILKPNAHEASVLTEVDVHDRDSALRAARTLRKRGVSTVAIEAGEKGNLVVWDGGEEFVPRMKVKSVDATGAGDAFAAALAVAVCEGMSMRDAAWFASAAAALKTTKLGAQAGLPHRGEVDRFLRRRR